MKKLAFLVAMFAFVSCGSKETPVDPDPGPDTPVADSFVKGADISWASEMEAGGRTWKKKNGTAASLLDVLKDCGLNAVRLRVWVDPYKGWSGKEDVVTAAKRPIAPGWPS